MADDQEVGRTIGGQIRTVSSRFFVFRDGSVISENLSEDPLLKPLQQHSRDMAGEGIEPPTRGFSVLCSAN
jgi:hypothetical protein